MTLKVSLLLFLLLSFSAPAYAGEIFGSLKEGDSSVGLGIRVEIVCGTSAPYSGQTDDYGSYRVYVRDRGACTLKVLYKGDAPQFEIQSYDDPERYDFQLVRGADGRYVLRRT